MQRLRSKLSYANVISTLCLFLLLGGGAYAAIKLPKNSVGTPQIKNNAVNGTKVADGSLTGADISGSVGSASSADTANHAATSDNATHADAADNANHASNSDALQGHPASDFLAASGTAADSSKLGGLNPSDYGDVESANVNGLTFSSAQYGAISGWSTGSATERDSISPNRDVVARDFSVQLDAAVPSGHAAIIYLLVNGAGGANEICGIGLGQSSCTNAGPVPVPAGSKLSLAFTGSGGIAATTAMVGFRLAPN